jgi:pimeloyl-ACP methyl ester carboxylesterase
MTKTHTPTIVFLHGAWASPNCFNYIREKLVKHRAILPEYAFGPALYDIARSVAYDINSQLKTDEYILIGHSLGGVLGYRLALDDQRCKKLVTISSPFNGSVHAATAHNLIEPWPPKTDLVPSSEFLTRLRTSEAKFKSLSLISTGGKIPMFNEPNDNVISVATQINSPIANQKTIETTHSEILQHETTVKEIQRFISV